MPPRPGGCADSHLWAGLPEQPNDAPECEARGERLHYGCGYARSCFAALSLGLSRSLSLSLSLCVPPQLVFLTLLLSVSLYLFFSALRVQCQNQGSFSLIFSLLFHFLPLSNPFPSSLFLRLLLFLIHTKIKRHLTFTPQLPNSLFFIKLRERKKTKKTGNLKVLLVVGLHYALWPGDARSLSALHCVGVGLTLLSFADLSVLRFSAAVEGRMGAGPAAKEKEKMTGEEGQ